MIRVPITDGTGKPVRPIERVKQNRPIVVVSQDVDDGMKQASSQEEVAPAAEAFRYATRSTRPPHQHKQNGQHRWRVEKVVQRNPDGIVVVQILKNVLAHFLARHFLPAAEIPDRPER